MRKNSLIHHVLPLSYKIISLKYVSFPQLRKSAELAVFLWVPTTPYNLSISIIYLLFFALSQIKRACSLVRLDLCKFKMKAFKIPLVKTFGSYTFLPFFVISHRSLSSLSRIEPLSKICVLSSNLLWNCVIAAL